MALAEHRPTVPHVHPTGPATELGLELGVPGVLRGLTVEPLDRDDLLPGAVHLDELTTLQLPDAAELLLLLAALLLVALPPRDLVPEHPLVVDVELVVPVEDVRLSVEPPAFPVHVDEVTGDVQHHVPTVERAPIEDLAELAVDVVPGPTALLPQHPLQRREVIGQPHRATHAHRLPLGPVLHLPPPAPLQPLLGEELERVGGLGEAPLAQDDAVVLVLHDQDSLC